MPGREPTRHANPFLKSAFFPGEAQEESLARLDYLRNHGGGWCRLTGPRGIGKSMLRDELERRAIRRGEEVGVVECGAFTDADWLPLVADAWNLSLDRTAGAFDIRRAVEEHLIGLAAIRRTTWLLMDQVDELSPELVRSVRRLCGTAVRCRAALTVVLGGRLESEPAVARDEADLYLELWPWSADDCGRYVADRLDRVHMSNPFTDDAIGALHERTSGIPGSAAKLAEWTWLAAETESETEIGANLVHAVADELAPGPPRHTTYELSAAYGAW